MSGNRYNFKDPVTGSRIRMTRRHDLSFDVKRDISISRDQGMFSAVKKGNVTEYTADHKNRLYFAEPKLELEAITTVIHLEFKLK